VSTSVLVVILVIAIILMCFKTVSKDILSAADSLTVLTVKLAETPESNYIIMCITCEVKRQQFVQSRQFTFSHAFGQ